MVLKEIAEKFSIGGKFISAKEYGSGHINDTFLISSSGGEKHIIQKINTFVFREPVLLMENIVNVTSHLSKKIASLGGDEKRETIKVIPSRDGLPYHVDGEGNYWRVYSYIENSFSYDKAESMDNLYQSALAFGRFQRLLSDFDAGSLHRIIENFHNTKVRYLDFLRALQEDREKRAGLVLPEAAFLKEREDLASAIQDPMDTGVLPLRVTHNDTKLNNVLFDTNTKKALCVVDLDTVMPGSILFDFGDAVRTGACSAAEDETDLTKVNFDLKAYEAFVRGFLQEAGSTITEKERELMPLSAIIISLEQGIRFLTDYLQGDVYYKTFRESHNLDRCRTQLKLVRDLEDNLFNMEEILRKYIK